MSTAQFTLCGREGRELIALALLESRLFDPYLEKGRVLFKGSATVSCLTRRLVDTPLRICGRITARGMKGPLRPSEGAHFLLYQGGEVTNVDGSAGEVLKTFGPGDLFVTGANALDSFGHAALLIGSPGGGGYGECMGALYTEGFRTLILSSAAKLIPGDLTQLYSRVSRKNCDFSYGMACSLAPVPGEVITEPQALSLFARVEALIFAGGGHTGAEDALAIQISGERDQVEKVLDLVERVKALPDSPMGEEDSEAECAFPCSSCGPHLSCRYAGKQRIYPNKKE
jgi:hypothetical protein